MIIAGLLSTEEEAEEIKFISRIFLVSIRVHELVEGQKIQDTANKIIARGVNK